MIIYVSTNIQVLFTHKVWRKIKDALDIPSHPIHPSHPYMNTGPLRDIVWTPCFYQLVITSMISKTGDRHCAPSNRAVRVLECKFLKLTSHQALTISPRALLDKKKGWIHYKTEKRWQVWIQTFFNFERQKTLLIFSKKWLNYIKNKVKRQSLAPNIWKLTYIGLFRKWRSPAPNLTSNFETHRTLGEHFFTIYISTYNVLYLNFWPKLDPPKLNFFFQK